MKYLLCWVLCLGILISSSAAHAFAVQEVTTKKGVTAWLAYDDRLPLVSMDFMWRGGVEQDAGDKQGLATLTMSLLNEGAGSYNAEEFQKALADHSIDMTFSATRDSLEGSAKFLVEDEAVAVDLLRSALLKPHFDQEAFDRALNQQKASIGFSLGDGDWQARYALFQKIFKGHPYSYRALGSIKGLDALSVGDVKTFAANHLAKDNLIVAVAGKIDAAHLAVLLDKVFGSLPDKANLAPIAASTIPVAQSVGVTRKGTQTSILFALPAPGRNDPDWYAATVANYILGGGGFESKLMAALRAKEGMTYGISTGLAAMDKASLLVGTVSVENERAGDAWAMIKATLDDLRRKGVAADDVNAAKAFLISSAPLTLTSSSAVSASLARWRFWGYSPHYFNDYAALIQKVSVQDVATVFTKWFDPAKLSVSAVGEPRGLDLLSIEKEVKE